MSPLNPKQGEAVVIRAAVLNDGSLDAADVIVQFLDVTDDEIVPIGEKQVLPLVAAGGSAVAEMTYDTSGLDGTRSIEVSVDPNNFVEEANEEDNTATRTVTIASAAMPNLMMLSGNISFEPPVATEGDEVTIRAVVLNNGASDAERRAGAVRGRDERRVRARGHGADDRGRVRRRQCVRAGRRTTRRTRPAAAASRCSSTRTTSIAESDENDNDAIAVAGGEVRRRCPTWR